MINTKKTIMEIIRYEKPFTKSVSPFINLIAVNFKLLNQDNILDLMDTINDASSDETRSINFIILFPSNQYKEYATGEEFMIDLTDELEKMDMGRYMLMLNPFPKKEETPA